MIVLKVLGTLGFTDSFVTLPLFSQKLEKNQEKDKKRCERRIFWRGRSVVFERVFEDIHFSERDRQPVTFRKIGTPGASRRSRLAGFGTGWENLSGVRS